MSERSASLGSDVDDQSPSKLGQVAAALDEMVSVRLQREPAGAVQASTLKAVMDAAVDGMVTINEAGIIKAFNPRAEKVFQYRSEEVVGKNVKVLMPPPYHDEHDEYIAAYLRTGDKKIIGVGREVMARRKNGKEFPIELAVSELTLNGQRVFVAVIRDITERMQAQERLRRLNEELETRVRLRTQQLEDVHSELIRKEKLAVLGQLAGSVAHEIRNPLGVIKNSTYYLELVNPKDDEETLNAWAEVKRALDSASRIISELLDYARDPQVDPVKSSARSLIEHALSAVRPVPANVTVNVVDDDSLPDVFADAGQVQQVLENLIQNAIQAMPHGGQLTLKAAKNSHSRNVAIDVQDTGQGIATEDLSHIFEPLFSRKAKGIGLGLSLSRRYAELNQGTLEVTSQLGQGTTFRLTLPEG